LWVTPDRHHAAFQTISALLDVGLREQPDGDLGQRMLAAVRSAQGPVIVIGTDCPALAPEHLRAAGEALRDGVDAVVIPVEDGGYALIGMRRRRLCSPASAEHGCGDGNPVSSCQLGLSWREPARLWDVDCRPTRSAQPHSLTSLM
jgi:glycosyltransferase A (GT-A) superfamily protein (DUF2064 family)